MTQQNDEIDFKAWKTFEHTGWEKAATAYDNTLGKVTRQAVEPLLDAAGVTAGLQVLDVATGPGYAAAAAGARGAHVVGVDFSERMIERAWWQFPGIQFRRGDAEDLPLSDSAFDAVVSNFGILHFGNPDKALAEAYRVLSPGGRVAFTVWRTDDPNSGFGLIHSVIDQLGTEQADMPEGAPYAQFADPDVARRRLELIGFEQVKCMPFNLTWRLTGAGEMVQALMHGAVRTAAMLNAQSPEVIAAIREQLDEQLRQYVVNGYIEFPMPVLLTSGTKRGY